MKDRWLPIGVLAGLLFAINIVARLVTRLGGFAAEDQQLRIGIISMVATGVLLIGATARWAVRYPIGRVVADLSAAAGIACLLSVVVGPFVAGSKPFAGGLGFFVGQILLFALLSGAGMLFGFLGVVVLGKDYKSRSLKRYAQNYKSKPPRVVRG
jgi:hypothetical protein